MNMNGNRTIMCNMVNHVLIPHPAGNIQVLINESLTPDHTKVASIQYGGEIKAFVTYGIINNRPAGYTVTSDDPLGYVASTMDHLLPFL